MDEFLFSASYNFVFSEFQILAELIMITSQGVCILEGHTVLYFSLRAALNNTNWWQPRTTLHYTRPRNNAIYLQSNKKTIINDSFMHSNKTFRRQLVGTFLWKRRVNKYNNKYLTHAFLSRTHEPLIYRQEQHAVYLLAKKYFCIPATSVPLAKEGVNSTPEQLKK